MKKRLVTYISLMSTGLLMLLIFAGFIYDNLHYYKHKNDWKAKTTPLNQKKIDSLCTNFELNKENPLCNNTKDVYGPDFIDIIRDTFRPYKEYAIPSNEAASYYEVEEKIGEFKLECEDVIYQADGFTYFDCQYDLRGDGEFPIRIMFTYPEMATFRIMMSLGYDGE